MKIKEKEWNKERNEHFDDKVLKTRLDQLIWLAELRTGH